MLQMIHLLVTGKLLLNIYIYIYVLQLLYFSTKWLTASSRQDIFNLKFINNTAAATTITSTNNNNKNMSNLEPLLLKI